MTQMKFTRRQVEILHYLNEYRDTTIKQIAQKIGVTGQTIKSEIMALEDILKCYEITVEFQSGKGIKVDGGNHLQELLRVSETNIEFRVQDQILLLLILNREYLVLQDIADTLFISKSQVEKLMPSLIKHYKGEIQSARHYGYRYSGTEVNRRAIFVRLIAPYMRATDLKQCLEAFSDTHFSIKPYFKDTIIQKGTEVLHFILGFEQLTFTDSAIQELFLYLLLILKANAEEGVIEEAEECLTGIKKPDQIKWYREYVDKIDNELNIALKTCEKEYLTYLLMTLKKKKTLNKEEILMEMRELVERLLRGIKTKFFIDLTCDEHLIEGLSYHIYTMFLSSQAVQPTKEESMCLEIKRHYPLGYEMAALAVDILKETYDYEVDERERCYLTLHFQAAIEKLKQVEQRIKTVIVCHFGMAACHLISRRIERFFPQIDIVGTYSVREFSETGNIACDLIVSTEKLKDIGITTLYVTPALKEVELERIREFVRTRNTKDLIANEIMNAEIIHFNAPVSKKEVIDKMVGTLKEAGYVSEEYLTSIYEREMISSTAMQDIAVPHGNPKYVH